MAEEQLVLEAWTHDAIALAAPAKVLCREDCAGLCPVCGSYGGREVIAPGGGHDHEHDHDHE